MNFVVSLEYAWQNSARASGRTSYDNTRLCIYLVYGHSVCNCLSVNIVENLVAFAVLVDILRIFASKFEQCKFVAADSIVNRLLHNVPVTAHLVVNLFAVGILQLSFDVKNQINQVYLFLVYIFDKFLESMERHHWKFGSRIFVVNLCNFRQICVLFVDFFNFSTIQDSINLSVECKIEHSVVEPYLNISCTD